MSALAVVPFLSRAAAVTVLLAGVAACAPGAQTPGAVASVQPPTGSPLASTPVLLSCPSGQQPLMRQVLINGAPVPQVECVAATSMAAAMPPSAPAAAAPAAVMANAFAPPYGAAVAPLDVPVAAAPAPVRTASRAQARRVVYDDDIVEYRRPSRRTWQKSAVIIGSAAGVGAGVGAATGGKKGALIGAAVGGGAATVWDQVTRRQPR